MLPPHIAQRAAAIPTLLLTARSVQRSSMAPKKAQKQPDEVLTRIAIVSADRCVASKGEKELPVVFFNCDRPELLPAFS